MEFTQMDVGRIITCPCSFLSALPQLAGEKRFLQRSQRDARKDTNCKTMTLVDGKVQAFTIIKDEWSAHLPSGELLILSKRLPSCPDPSRLS
jgi:hypothetical protein